MPAATTKAALIDVCEMEFGKLTRTLDGVDEQLAEKRFEDGVSIKRTVAHRAHWIGLFQRWWADGQAGRAVHMPDSGVGWNDLKSYNAGLHERYGTLNWAATQAFLSGRHGALMTLLNSLDDAELYGEPMIGGNGKWTAGRYAESAGSSHYRSANKVIRACLRSVRE